MYEVRIRSPNHNRNNDNNMHNNHNHTSNSCSGRSRSVMRLLVGPMPPLHSDTSTIIDHHPPWPPPKVRVQFLSTLYSNPYPTPLGPFPNSVIFYLYSILTLPSPYSITITDTIKTASRTY